MIPPLCRYCGKPIAKRTNWVRFTLARTEYQKNETYVRYIEVPAYPKSKAECQKLTNLTVVSVRWAEIYDDNHVMSKPYIESFGEWDGKSYKDAYFCNGDHAKSFGYVMAGSGYATKAFNAALAKQTEKAA